MFAKLIDSILTYAPSKLVIGNSTVYNPTAEQYRLHGWKELKIDAYPEIPEGYHAEPQYEEKTKYIYQHWNLVEDPEPEPTLEEQVEAQAEAIEELASMLAEVMNG